MTTSGRPPKAVTDSARLPRRAVTAEGRLPKAVTRKSRLKQPSTWAGLATIALALSQLPDALTVWGEKLNGAFGLTSAEWTAIGVGLTVLIALAGWLAVQLNEG